LASVLGFSGVSYVPKVTPKECALTSFNTKGGALLYGIKTVCIDAGHGGKDAGCIGVTGVKEKDVALGIALKLGKYIEQKIPDVKVVYTRTTDAFVELDERAAIANKNKADLFICIHCNTACSQDKSTRRITCNETISGTETYVMGLHKTSANLNVAKRENESIMLEKNYQKRYGGFDPNDEAGYILMTIQQNVYHKQSVEFAAKIQKHVKDKVGRNDKGVHQAGFLVLWKTTMPSVLIETEFLSNPAAEKFMASEKGQDYMARAIFSAFREYKDEVEGRLMKYDDEFENTRPDANAAKEIKEDTAKIKEKVNAENKVKELKKEPLVKADDKVILKDTIHTVIQMPSYLRKDSAENISVADTTKKEVTDAISSGQIIYKVQFMSSSKRIPLLSDKFKGLKDVAEYEDNGVYKYTAGEFKTLEDAMKYRTEMQKNGYKDCFVVRFKDGKRIKNN
jgi:N-acetylmuramoyl-L-alanine amidase